MNKTSWVAAATLVFAVASHGLTAQGQVPTRPTIPAAATAAPEVSATVDARTTREQLREVLQRLPPDVGRIVKMDPTLLRSESYLAQYPSLASFLSAHPEVAHNPNYYLEFVQTRWDEEPLDSRLLVLRLYRNAMEGVMMFTVFVTASAFLAWFVRTFIDYRRWLRLSKTQTEVHNKLLERFAGTGDLLAYVQSPAGRRFLESAPIPLDASPRQVAAPFGRILLAVQAGVVIGVVGVGFQVVSARVIDDLGQPLSVLGVLALALGVGLILSGLVSYLLARRFGLMAPAATLERQDSSLA